MNNKTIRDAAAEWVDTFNFVPGSVIEKMAEADENIRLYDSDSFRLVASARIKCASCFAAYEGDLSLDDLSEAFDGGEGVPCENCGSRGDEWTMGMPEHGFPCGWATLFAPKDCLDVDWVLDNRDRIAQLGFFVFESDDFGCLLGIDAGGFDFYEAYWTPLYRLRGLKWHDTE